MLLMDSGFSYVKIIGQLCKFDSCRDYRAQRSVPSDKDQVEEDALGLCTPLPINTSPPPPSHHRKMHRGWNFCKKGLKDLGSEAGIQWY
jgi:hypothetical protein